MIWLLNGGIPRLDTWRHTPGEWLRHFSAAPPAFSPLPTTRNHAVAQAPSIGCRSSRFRRSYVDRNARASAYGFCFRIGSASRPRPPCHRGRGAVAHSRAENGPPATAPPPFPPQLVLSSTSMFSSGLQCRRDPSARHGTVCRAIIRPSRLPISAQLPPRQRQDNWQCDPVVMARLLWFRTFSIGTDRTKGSAGADRFPALQ